MIPDFFRVMFWHMWVLDVVASKKVEVVSEGNVRFWLIAVSILDLGYGGIEGWKFDTRRKVGVQVLIGLK